MQSVPLTSIDAWHGQDCRQVLLIVKLIESTLKCWKDVHLNDVNEIRHGAASLNQYR
jgi:hypothetical protein